MGFSVPRIRDKQFDQHRILIQALGLTIVKENGAGLIARNPPRTASEKQALRDRWSVASMTNGYHSSIAPTPDMVKWVQVDLGCTPRFHKIRICPARPNAFPHP